VKQIKVSIFMPFNQTINENILNNYVICIRFIIFVSPNLSITKNNYNGNEEEEQS